MELVGHDNAESPFYKSIKWRGEQLAPEATGLCFVLACCRCDRVPALLFVRPFFTQKRWNVDGEIEATRPRDHEIPPWAKETFQHTQFDGVATDRDFVYSGTALGILDRVSDGDYYLAPAIQSLCQQDILIAEVDEDVLFFKMDEIEREKILKQSSVNDRLLVWLDLLKLIIHSHPDLYSEFLWRRVAACCKLVIDSTVMPFISVLDWSQLQPYQSIITSLIPFLIHYSVFNGFSVGTCLHLSQNLLRYIRVVCTLEVKHMITLLEFSEDLAHQLLQSHTKERENIGTLFKNTQACLETARLRGLFGFLVSSISRSISGLPNRVDVYEAVQLWRNGSKEPRSTMERLAQIPFTNSDPMVDLDEHLLNRMDLHTNCAIASALIEHDDCIRTYQSVNTCLKLFGNERFSGSIQLFTFIAELVKCCNVLGRNADAEVLARRALKASSGNKSSAEAISYMRTLLADAFIGQGLYLEAREILKTILAESPSTYLKQVVTLRLNKVERRLGTLDMSAFVSITKSFTALSAEGQFEDDIKQECLDELSATVYYIQQRITGNTTISPKFISERGLTGTNSIYVTDWRAPFLDKQIQIFKNTGEDHDDWREMKKEIESAWERYRKVLNTGRWGKGLATSAMPSGVADKLSEEFRDNSMESHEPITPGRALTSVYNLPSKNPLPLEPNYAMNTYLARSERHELLNFAEGSDLAHIEPVQKAKSQRKWIENHEKKINR